MRGKGMDNNIYLILVVSLAAVLLCFLSIILLWIYQYTVKVSADKVENKVRKMLINIMSLESDERENTIIELCEFVKKKHGRIQLLINVSLEYMDNCSVEEYKLFLELYEKSGVTHYLIKRLSSKNKFVVSMVCRYLGDLRIKGAESHLRDLVNYANDDVMYNILLSLSKLGDEEGITIILTNYANRINLSYRAIVEIISIYSGSKMELLKRIVTSCDDYIRGVIIKAAASYRFEEMKDYYVKYIKSEDKNVRIASIRALSELGDKSQESYLSDMLFDSAWEVRAAAAKCLEKIGTSKSFSILAKAISDSEWWVRHNAASTLILLPGGREYADKVINGDDMYARDAIKYALEISEDTTVDNNVIR
jgi:hypothetical protein